MGLKKIKATQLFDGYRFRDNAVLLLSEEGVVVDIVDAAEAGDDVLWIDGILAPGFVNCHCHLELSHLKEVIQENTGLTNFVKQVVNKRVVSKNEILKAIENADAEMLQNGIVAVGDICNTTDTLLQKSVSPLHYHNFVEAFGSDPEIAEKSFSNYREVYKQFAESLGASHTTIAPHAPYSVSEPLWKKIMEHNTNGLFTIHNQETEDETIWFAKKTGGFAEMFKAMGVNTNHFIASGKSSLQTFLPKFSPTQQILLVHNVFTTEADIQFAEALNQNIYWCLCPNANQYISRQLPNLPVFVRNSAKMVIGTDSLASNHQLNIYEEIKIMLARFPQISLEEMLGWATINGAKALKIDSRYGSFEKGKKPGLVMIANGKAMRLN